MHDVELTVRSPTGSAWLCSAFSVILTGELYFEIQNKTVHYFLGHTFSSDEATPLVIGATLICILSIAWLLSFYLCPGKIKINQSEGSLSRVQFTPLGSKEITEPMECWTVKVVFFSQNDLNNQVFKKVIMGTSTYKEVILYSDTPNRDHFLMTLNEIQKKLKSFKIEIIPSIYPIN